MPSPPRRCPHPRNAWFIGCLAGLAFTLLGAWTDPAQAQDEYCVRTASTCISSLQVNSLNDTYFWSPMSPPPSTTSINFGPLRNNLTVSKMTLHGPSTTGLNATGSPQKETLIGSLGNNTLSGVGGGDTYVIGNETSVTKNLSSCSPTSINDCVYRISPGQEQDFVKLGGSPDGKDIVYINKCLQLMATGNPGKGGDSVRSAVASPLTPPDGLGGSQRPSPINEPVAVNCRMGIPMISPLTAQQPPSNASLFKSLRTNLANVIRFINFKLTGRVPLYVGTPRIIQPANFGGAEGDRIAIETEGLRFNDAPLTPEQTQVFVQARNRDPVAEGKALIYHEEIGVLASYGTDQAPYGSEANPGSVIAQLVRPGGRALKIGAGISPDALDWVSLVPPTPTGEGESRSPAN